jgi:flagellar basal body-associated protein FliL
VAENTDREDKLKELEKSLAEELDQGGSPAESTPSPIEVPVPSETPIGAGSEPLEISPDEFDALLREEDPNFEKELAEIHADIQSASKDLDIPTLDVEGDLLKPMDTEKDEAEPPQVPKGFFFSKLADLFRRLSAALAEFRKSGLKSFLLSLKKALPKLLSSLQNQIAKVGAAIRGFLGAILGLPLKTKISLVIGILLLAVSGTLIRSLMRGQIIGFAEHEDFISSFDQVAGKITEFSEDTEMEDFNSPLRHPEHIVLLHKIIVNLKASANSGSRPMAAIELYVEASNREAAIEIKDREREIIDVVSRVAESLPYDDIEQIAGKEKFKLILRREINQIMNTGRIQKVYFKTLFYKR